MIEDINNISNKLFLIIGSFIEKIYTKKENDPININLITNVIDYSLLLIIPANQSRNFKTNQIINKDEASKLINHAKRAYCFIEDNSEGINIAKNVKCSDDSIDYKSESSVFVYLSITSSNKNMASERIRSNISDQISNSYPIKINKIAKLQSALSTKDFYDI